MLVLVPLLCGAVPRPAEWVPVRWPWADEASLELLTGTPANCLLLKDYPAPFVKAAADKGLVTLAVLTPGGDVVAATRQALDAKVTGIVLQGDFAEGTAPAVRAAANGAPVIELTSRSRMALASTAPILGTYQGVWPGIGVQDNGEHKAGPTGSTWIDTNTGFIRAARAWGNASLWIANEPPPQTAVTGPRYLQVIADAAISGARWVVAFDADFASRLHRREAPALGNWKRMSDLLRYFERHPEWRDMQEYGKLAVVQDPAKGGLLSGGILDMIAVKHTPVRPIPQQHLTPESLQGSTMAVNVEGDALTPEEKDVLRRFAQSGGTLLTAPPGWKDESPQGNRITLEKQQVDRLNDIWKEVNSMVGRRNLGVKLYNVATMLSNVVASPDGKIEVVQLVNYSDYPVDDITMHFLGNFKRAVLTTPDGIEKTLPIYSVEEEGFGVDIDKVNVCATIRLEQ